jgi:DNA-binding LacI/PurR family transcriptional regulator
MRDGPDGGGVAVTVPVSAAGPAASEIVQPLPERPLPRSPVDPPVSSTQPGPKPAVPTSAPTLEDVARVAGVSRATVSRVVNGHRQVAPGLQEVVRRAVSETGYVPNLAARSLVTRRTGTVAVVVSGADDATRGGAIDFADPFFGRAVGGLLRALRPHEVDPVLMIAETQHDRARVMSVLHSGNAAGALLVSTHADDPLPAMLVQDGVPAVMFARPAVQLPISFVDVGNRDGGALAAQHLLARGRHRIAVISGPLDVPAAADRLGGFRDEMARRGHPDVPTAEGNFTYSSGITAMDLLLAEDAAIDGVFAGNDLMALGAIQALHASGRLVPDDVSVVGFDDSSIGSVSRPALTTVRQPIEEMTVEMAHILLEAVAEPGRRPTSVIFEPALIVRAST